MLWQGAALHSLWVAVSKEHTESEDLLRPCAFAEDGKSYFNLFGMCKKDRHCQGLLMPMGKDPPLFISSDVLWFGSVTGPLWAQRLSAMMVALIRRRLWQFELKLLEAAERCCPVASPIMPEMHRERARAATKAGRGCVSLPSSVVQYIDDIHGKSMGKVRAMVGLLSAWQEMERMNVPYGVEENTKEWPDHDGVSAKAQFGEVTEFNGVSCFWARGVVAVIRRKRYVLLRWLRRVRARTWVILRECESLWGTAGNAAAFMPGARRFLGHGYRAKANRHYVIPSKFGLIIRVSAWMRDALSGLEQTLVDTEARPFYDNPTAAREEASSLIQSVTDAARTVSREKFSGMGGVLLYGRHAVMRHYRYDHEVLVRIPINILEIWGSFIGILLISAFKALLREMGEVVQVDRCLERIDNMSVVVPASLLILLALSWPYTSRASSTCCCCYMPNR